MKKIEESIGTHVVLKFKNGRAISGIIRGDRESGFTVKLGVLHISVDPQDLVRLTPLIG